MDVEAYVREFRRWTRHPVRGERTAELRAHLDEARASGDLEGALRRLGTPREAARTFGEGDALAPAPLIRRFAGAVVDYGIITVLVLAGPIAAAIGGVEGWEVSWTGVRGSESPWPLVSVPLGLSWFAVGNTILEWRTGRTPGKALLGMRVASEDGTAPGFWQIVVRRLPLVFSGVLQLVDWLFVFVGDKHQRAFDRVARTIVISEGGTPPRAVPSVVPG